MLFTTQAGARDDFKQSAALSTFVTDNYLISYSLANITHPQKIVKWTKITILACNTEMWSSIRQIQQYLIVLSPPMKAYPLQQKQALLLQ